MIGVKNGGKRTWQRKKVINKLIKEKHPRLYYRVKESYRKYGKRHRTGEK